MIRHSFKLIWNQKKKNAFIILELFFLFVVLLISSVYLIEKYELYSGGVGAKVDHLLAVSVIKKDYKARDYTVTLQNMSRELKSLPDIEQVSYSSQSIPYIWSMSSSSMKYDSNYVNSTVMRRVDENFGDLFGIKMVAGRWFRDDYGTVDPPIVIDIQAAEKLFGTPENALNKTVEIDGKKHIVGVYQMMKRNEYEENFPSCFYPLNQKELTGFQVVLKYRGTKTPNLSKLQQIIHAYFYKNDYAIRGVSTMEEKRADVLSETNLEIVLVSVFTVFLVVNMILGIIGIFGYNIKQRKSELGIRRAVGSPAQKLHVLLLFESWSLTLLALIPAIILMIQIPILDLYPIEMHLFLKGLGISILLIFFLVGVSVYYPAYLASKIQTAEALQEE